MTTEAFLQVYRVLDLSQYIPGPFATRQLADLGADVIKIQPPSGDLMRHFMSIPDENTRYSPIYQHLNRGKRIVTMDLKPESGKLALCALTEQSDVLLESFRPGVMAKLSFDQQFPASDNALEYQRTAEF